MKSRLNRECSNERTYPYLAVGKNSVIVLFTAKDTGMVVNTGTSTAAYIGEWDTQWAEDRFIVYSGEVILSN